MWPANDYTRITFESPSAIQHKVFSLDNPDRLVLDLNVQSEAGHIRGQVTSDVKAPDLAASGNVEVERLNLAPLLKDPAQRSDITGQAQIDLRFASAPAAKPAIDRLSGSFAFRGPAVAAAGYQARNARATGTFTNGPFTSLAVSV